MNNPTVRTDLHARVVDDELIVLDVSRNSVHRLNHAATSIWFWCDGEHGIDDIVTRLAATYAVPIERVSADVRRTLGEFEQLGLLS